MNYYNLQSLFEKILSQIKIKVFTISLCSILFASLVWAQSGSYQNNNLDQGLNIKVLKELDYWLEYQLPKDLVGIIWQGKYRGQKQKWFVVKFFGLDNEINLNTKKPEFIEWKWLDISKLPDVIVDFKKNVYKKLVKELDKIIV